MSVTTLLAYARERERTRRVSEGMRCRNRVARDRARGINREKNKTTRRGGGAVLTVEVRQDILRKYVYFEVQVTQTSGYMSIPEVINPTKTQKCGGVQAREDVDNPHFIR